MTHRAPLYTRIERRSTQVELLTWINVGLLQTTLRPADAMPFSATDWPVPQRRQFPTALLQWQDSLLEIAIPIWPTDWPNPVERGPDIFDTNAFSDSAFFLTDSGAAVSDGAPIFVTVIRRRILLYSVILAMFLAVPASQALLT